MTTQSHTIGVPKWNLMGLHNFLWPYCHCCDHAHSIVHILLDDQFTQKWTLNSWCLHRNSASLWECPNFWQQMTPQKLGYDPRALTRINGEPNRFAHTSLGPSWATFTNNFLVVERYFTSYLDVSELLTITTVIDFFDCAN